MITSFKFKWWFLGWLVIGLSTLIVIIRSIKMVVLNRARPKQTRGFPSKSGYMQPAQNRDQWLMEIHTYILYILYITTQISNYDYKYYILIMVFPIDGESLYSCSCVYIYIYYNLSRLMGNYVMGNYVIGILASRCCPRDKEVRQVG